MFDKLLGKGKAAQVTESLWAMNSKQQTTMLVTTQPATSVAQQKRQLSPLDPTGEPKPRQRVLGDFYATLPALNPVRLPPSDGASCYSDQERQLTRVLSWPPLRPLVAEGRPGGTVSSAATC